MAQTPDVTISMLKDADCQGKGKKGASKSKYRTVDSKCKAMFLEVFSYSI